MSRALEEFLALRQASEGGSFAVADRLDPDGGYHQTEESSEEVRVSHAERQTQAPAETCPSEMSGCTPDSGINERELAAYFVDLLAAHPSAGPVKNRSGLADYLARGVVHRYSDPVKAARQYKTPLRCHMRTKAYWIAQCPAGHLTQEVIESHEVVGWACERCQRVYDVGESRLVPSG